MSERLFLLELKMELRGLPDDVKDEILVEYETYFEEARKEGLTESETIERLGGSGKNVAQTILEKIEQEDDSASQQLNTGRNIIVAIGLIFFNLIVVLGPFIAVTGAGIALLITFGIFFISPVLVLMQFVFQGGHLFELMLSFILFGSTLLTYPYVRKGITYFITLIRTYIDWNKRLIRGGAS